MNINEFIFKLKRKVKYIIGYLIFQYPRILKYKILSNCKNIVGKPIYNQPTQLLEKGYISFGKNVNLGVVTSPFFYNGYGYIVTKSIPSNVIAGGYPAKVIKEIDFN